ncbi:MAG: hypothetical protein IPI39_21295 [Candidatus Obscuribacter sp.]|nr:hypothetical protein [Candidatus Obscuribacter sp.]
MFSSLKDWHRRHGEEHSLRGVISRLRGPSSTITEATIIPFNPPAIRGLVTLAASFLSSQDMFGTDIGALADVASG